MRPSPCAMTAAPSCWGLVLLAVFAVAYFHGLDAVTRQRLAAMIGSFILAPANSRLVEPPTTPPIPVSLRTL